ncbi:hypothetical protein SLS62_009503 [Diatrype stigma]|uniref:C6 transcription factor n=1 Tax=Diatrype stigma TaxID=117547 RepID=A0AAN9UD80_9PEZI
MVTTRSGGSRASTPAPPFTPATATATSKSSSTSSSRRSNQQKQQRQQLWAHAPSRLTLLWLAVSLPLVTWDSLYVLLRPWTMEGGHLHWPLWVPYKLYGEVDHVYGWKAFRAGNGFTSAQGSLNVVETALYLAYLGIYFASAIGVGNGKGRRQTGGGQGKKVLTGRPAAVAVLLAFSAAVMTLSKTVLYWLNEYFSGFDNIGHNSWQDLVLLWIIPNGAWLVFPTYLIYVLGGEMIDGLTAASAGVAIKSE